MFRRIFILPLVISFVFCFFTANIAYSEVTGKTAMQQQWVNIFPIGTEIHSLAIDPQNEDIIYVSTYRGLFKSEDRGKLYTPLYLTQELVESSIIQMDPISSKTLYWVYDNIKHSILGKEGRVYLLKSKDGGMSWDDISAGVIKDKVYAIAIHPKKPEIMYVASEGGLFKTFNGGKTWGKIGGAAYSVFLNPDSPDEVYATVQKKLHRSTDGGQSFDLIDPTFIYTYKTRSPIDGSIHREEQKYTCDSVYAILNPHDVQEMLAACYGGGWQSIIVSRDRGKTWDLLNEQFREFGSGERVTQWFFHSKKRNLIYFVVKTKRDKESKILKSIDGGKTWIPLPIPPSTNITNFEMVLPDIIYVATDYGIYKTTDDGKNWEPRSFGLPAKTGIVNKKELVEIDAISGTIYIRNTYEGDFTRKGDIIGNGYWMSNDKGASWNWSGVPGLRQIIVTSDHTTYISREVSLDYWSWRLHVDKIVPNQKPAEVKISGFPKYLAVSPSNSQILYVVATEEKNKSVEGELLLKSEDGGFSWSQIKGHWEKILLLFVDPRTPDIVYAVVNRGIIKTVDGGKSWLDITRGLYTSIESIWSSSKWLNPKERTHIANLLVSTPTSLVIDPSNSNTVYLTTKDGGVYRSIDGGKTWQSKSPQNYLKTLITAFDNYSAQQCKGQKNCKGVTLDIALKGGIIMMAPQNTVIVYPRKVLDDVSFSFNNIAIDPSNPKTIYLATNKGVYRSFDRGDTWQLLDRGLLEPAVRRVLASSLTLAEGESGIYKLSE